MDEVESVLSQMRQGLAQNVFFHYEQLTRYVEDQDAAMYILTELRKMEGLFEKTGPSFSLFSNWDTLQKEWEDKSLQAAQSKDYHEQLKTEEVLQAIKVLKYTLEETENGN